MYGAFDVVLYFVIIQLFWLLINLGPTSYLILSYNIVLFLPSVILNDYFWPGRKFAYDTRHHDWSRGVLFSA